MAWNIESTETVKVEDPDPAIWARAAENALRQGSIDESIRNIDKALYYSNYSIHYKFEKVKILCATNRFIPCMQLLRENMHAFKNDYINQNKNIQTFNL